MKNLKVITKMALIGITVLAFTIFSILFSINSMNLIERQTIKGEEESIRTDYDNSIKNHIQIVITLLDSYNSDIQTGIYSKEESMKIAAGKIRALRYGTDGYFCDYQYPKESETELKPKRAYTQYYEPFDWVIGTGNYIDHIDEQIAISVAKADKFTNSSCS